MKRIILDTNCFLRFLLNDIPVQADKVEALLTQAEKNKIEIFVPQIVVFELHFVLEKYYKFSKNEVVGMLKTLLVAPYLSIEAKEIFLTAITLYGSAHTSLVDCFLVAQSQNNEAELFTFDQKLKRLTEL